MKINPNFKKIAVKAVKEAGKIIEKKFKGPNRVSYKKDSSVVTNIDFEAEKTIIKLIKKNFPSHNILAEEIGGRVGENYTWIIDPLDGTTNYISRMPFFSTSIALFYRRKPILGIIFNPISKEFYFAEKGRGAYLNGKRIKIGRKRILLKSVLALGRGRAREDFIKLQKVLEKAIGKCHTFRIWGSTSLGLCYVASGRIDGYIDVGSKPWDYAAGILIVKEAGGRVTDFRGKEWEIKTKNVVASNKEINKLLLYLLK